MSNIPDYDDDTKYFVMEGLDGYDQEALNEKLKPFKCQAAYHEETDLFSIEPLEE